MAQGSQSRVTPESLVSHEVVRCFRDRCFRAAISGSARAFQSPAFSISMHETRVFATKTEPHEASIDTLVSRERRVEYIQRRECLAFLFSHLPPSPARSSYDNLIFSPRRNMQIREILSRNSRIHASRLNSETQGAICGRNDVRTADQDRQQSPCLLAM